MSTPIIVAVIAAIASLFGTVVTVLVARQARHASLTQDQFRLMLKLSEERITRLRALAAATERLRASGMLLRSELQLSTGEKNGAKAEKARLNQLIKDFEGFWMQWADTKDDIPDTDLERLRSIRHEMRTLFADVELGVDTRRSREGIDDRQQQRRDTAIQTLLLRLDAFYGEVARLRSGALEAVILAAPINGRSVHPPGLAGARRRGLSDMLAPERRLPPSA